MRGMQHIRFWDFDKWLEDKKMAEIRDHSFLSDINSTSRLSHPPQEAAGRTIARLRQVPAGYEPSQDDIAFVLHALSESRDTFASGTMPTPSPTPSPSVDLDSDDDDDEGPGEAPGGGPGFGDYGQSSEEDDGDEGYDDAGFDGGPGHGDHGESGDEDDGDDDDHHMGGTTHDQALPITPDPDSDADQIDMGAEADDEDEDEVFILTPDEDLEEEPVFSPAITMDLTTLPDDPTGGDREDEVIATPTRIIVRDLTRGSTPAEAIMVDDDDEDGGEDQEKDEDESDDEKQDQTGNENQEASLFVDEDQSQRESEAPSTASSRRTPEGTPESGNGHFSFETPRQLGPRPASLSGGGSGNASQTTPSGEPSIFISPPPGEPASTSTSPEQASTVPYGPGIFTTPRQVRPGYLDNASQAITPGETSLFLSPSPGEPASASTSPEQASTVPYGPDMFSTPPQVRPDAYRDTGPQSPQDESPLFVRQGSNEDSPGPSTPGSPTSSPSTPSPSQARRRGFSPSVSPANTLFRRLALREVNSPLRRGENVDGGDPNVVQQNDPGHTSPFWRATATMNFEGPSDTPDPQSPSTPSTPKRARSDGDLDGDVQMEESGGTPTPKRPRSAGDDGDDAMVQ